MEEEEKKEPAKPDGILAGFGLGGEQQAGKPTKEKSALASEVSDRLHGKMGSVKQQLGAAGDIIKFAGS